MGEPFCTLLAFALIDALRDVDNLWARPRIDRRYAVWPGYTTSCHGPRRTLEQPPFEPPLRTHALDRGPSAADIKGQPGGHGGVGRAFVAASPINKGSYWPS